MAQQILHQVLRCTHADRRRASSESANRSHDRFHESRACVANKQTTCEALRNELKQQKSDPLLIQLTDFTTVSSAETTVNQLICGLAKEMNRSIRIRELSPAWMVTAKRIDISPVQWCGWIRFIVDGAMAGAVISVCIIRCRRRIIPHNIFSDQQSIAETVGDRRKALGLLVRDTEEQSIAATLFETIW